MVQDFNMLRGLFLCVWPMAAKQGYKAGALLMKRAVLVWTRKKAKMSKQAAKGCTSSQRKGREGFLRGVVEQGVARECVGGTIAVFTTSPTTQSLVCMCRMLEGCGAYLR